MRLLLLTLAWLGLAGCGLEAPAPEKTENPVAAEQQAPSVSYLDQDLPPPPATMEITQRALDFISEPPAPDQVSAFTARIVSRWGAAAEGYTRFFGNIYGTFNEDGAHWSSEEFRRFWADVFFYNYVQSFVRGGARVRPTAKMFADSAAAFHAVLNDVKPEAVVVMGQTTWDQMSDRDAELLDQDEDALGSVWRYRFDGGSCVAAHTHHPSSNGYSPDYWRPRALKFLAGVGAARDH